MGRIYDSTLCQYFCKKNNQLENLSHIATIVGVLLAIIVAIGELLNIFVRKKDKEYERYIEEKRNRETS